MNEKADPLNLLEPELVVGTTARFQLKEIAIWAKFLAILVFFSALLILGAGSFQAYLLASFVSVQKGAAEAMIAGVSGTMIYLVFAVTIFVMSLFLFRYSKSTDAALTTSDQLLFINSLKNLKIYFRFAGVIFLVILIFVTVALIINIADAHLLRR